jgi:hypothetical protein
MSADIIPLPVPQESSSAGNLAPMPAPDAAPAPEENSLSKLLKNPLVIAGGAMLAGMALTRLLSASPVRRLALELAEAAIRHSRRGNPLPPAPSLLEQGLETVRPRITEAAKGFLAEILRKR